MKCINQTQANRVAEAGFSKMTGYRMQESYTGKHYLVVKPNGDLYLVNKNLKSCSCEFFHENLEFQVCKHLLFCEENLRIDALAEIEEGKRDLIGATTDRYAF